MLRAILKPHRMLLAGIFALGLLLRVATLTQSLWYDEILTARVSQAAMADFMKELATYNMSRPPLFYFLSYIAMYIFPEDWACRIPALVFGLATLPLFWLLARRVVERHTAYVALFLLAISPISVRYAQEAREYSLLGFAALLGLYGLWTAHDRSRPSEHLLGSPFKGVFRKTWPWFLCFLGTALSIQSSFFAFPCLLAQSLLLAFLLYDDAMSRQLTWRRFFTVGFAYALCILAALALLLPWKSIVLGFLAGEGTFSTNRMTGAAIAFDAPFFRKLVFNLGWGAGAAFWVCCLALGFGIASALLDRRRLFWLGVSYGIGALLPFFVILRYTQMQVFEARYVIFLAPVVALLAAQGIVTAASYVVAVLPRLQDLTRSVQNAVAAVAACMVALAGFWPTISDMVVETKENWRDVCTFIARHQESGDAVLIQPAWAKYTLEFYGKDLPPILAFYPNDTKRWEAAFKNYSRIWFVGRWGAKTPELTQKMLARRFITLFDPWTQGLSLEIYDRTTNDANRAAATLEWRTRACQEIRYNPMMDLWLSRAYRDLQDLERAREYGQRAKKSLAAYLPAEMSYRWAYARLLKEIDEYEPARRAYLAYLRLDPWCSTAALELASMEAQHEDFQNAIEHYTLYMQLEPNFDKQVWFTLGSLQERAGNFPDAIRLYEIYMQQKPGFQPAALLAVAKLYERAGDVEAAFNALKTLSRKLKESEGAPPYYWAVGARILAHYGQVDRALDEFKQALAESPAYGYTYFHYASALIEAQRLQEAREVVKTGLASDPANQGLLKLQAQLDEPPPPGT